MMKSINVGSCSLLQNLMLRLNLDQVTQIATLITTDTKPSLIVVRNILEVCEGIKTSEKILWVHVASYNSTSYVAYFVMTSQEFIDRLKAQLFLSVEKAVEAALVE
jgi:hypothetical protein